MYGSMGVISLLANDNMTALSLGEIPCEVSVTQVATPTHLSPKSVPQDIALSVKSFQPCV